MSDKPSTKPSPWSTDLRCSICNMPVTDRFVVVQESTEGYGFYLAVACVHDAPMLNENPILGIAASTSCLAKILDPILHNQQIKENLS